MVYKSAFTKREVINKKTRAVDIGCFTRILWYELCCDCEI
jgi:hypothetical protein